MKRRHALTPEPIGDTDPVAPTPERPVRSRTRALAVDAHFEPHSHAWAQLAYCAQGLIQVTANDLDRETTFILPPSRAVWVPPDTRHAVTVLAGASWQVAHVIFVFAFACGFASGRSLPDGVPAAPSATNSGRR